ncbi:unnamed protein product [Cylindrotheca closterium]|uniref:Uncharacterized protein n=1 Tax=Cylindrotheca closterium TaxID=2856 RepID=A0AAD2FLC7_9STRA|nr:unnamed protein product [Cylindrotheca closterium]
MILTLLNFILWGNDEARGAFMFADCIVLSALVYVDKSMKAEQKVLEEEAANEVKQMHEMDKAAARAQDGATRSKKKANKKANGPSTGNKHFNIQQPAKRD